MIKMYNLNICVHKYPIKNMAIMLQFIQLCILLMLPWYFQKFQHYGDYEHSATVSSVSLKAVPVSQCYTQPVSFEESFTPNFDPTVQSKYQ